MCDTVAYGKENGTGRVKLECRGEAVHLAWGWLGGTGSVPCVIGSQAPGGVRLTLG